LRVLGGIELLSITADAREVQGTLGECQSNHHRLRKSGYVQLCRYLSWAYLRLPGSEDTGEGTSSSGLCTMCLHAGFSLDSLDSPKAENRKHGVLPLVDWSTELGSMVCVAARETRPVMRVTSVLRYMLIWLMKRGLVRFD